MSMIPIEEKDYGKGRTKQSMKESTEVNNILKRHQRAGTLSHLAKYEGVYGDFTNFGDLLDMKTKIDQGFRLFSELPSEVRKDFGQDPSRFFEFVNDPENKDKLAELLPKIAEPGSYFPSVIGPAPDPAPDPAPAPDPTPAPDPAPDPA